MPLSLVTRGFGGPCCGIAMIRPLASFFQKHKVNISLLLPVLSGAGKADMGVYATPSGDL